MCTPSQKYIFRSKFCVLCARFYVTFLTINKISAVFVNLYIYISNQTRIKSYLFVSVACIARLHIYLETPSIQRLQNPFCHLIRKLISMVFFPSLSFYFFLPSWGVMSAAEVMIATAVLRQ